MGKTLTREEAQAYWQEYTVHDAPSGELRPPLYIVDITEDCRLDTSDYRWHLFYTRFADGVYVFVVSRKKVGDTRNSFSVAFSLDKLTERLPPPDSSFAFNAPYLGLTVRQFRGLVELYAPE